jgi:hypothetical protein
VELKPEIKANVFEKEIEIILLHWYIQGMLLV